MPIHHALAFLACFAGLLSLAGGSLGVSSDFPTLSGLDGGQLTGAELEQGNMILVVWASWSPRCRDIATRVNTLARAWSPRARVATVVFQEDAEVVRQFLRKQGGSELNVPVYLDSSGSFSKKFAVTTLPGLLIIKGGQAEFQGKLPVNPDPVITRALGRKP